MVESRPRLVSYIYVSTRLRVRKASLFTFPVYRGLLRMHIAEIALFLMQNGYGTGFAEHVRQDAGPEAARSDAPRAPRRRRTRPFSALRRGSCGN